MAQLFPIPYVTLVNLYVLSCTHMEIISDDECWWYSHVECRCFFKNFMRPKFETITKICVSHPTISKSQSHGVFSIIQRKLLPLSSSQMDELFHVKVVSSAA
jgi:hypothetical protein